MSFAKTIKSIRRKVGWLLSDPAYVASYLIADFFPDYFGRRQRNISIVPELKDKFFILSFDCDTTKDFEVVEEVHARLQALGIYPSYAVPGQLLTQGRNVYQRIHKTGAEFINHGYLSHTDYIPDSRSYVSTIFYENLTNDEVRQDIVKGHQTIEELLGVTPKGFRTPHFGTYEKKRYLNFLHSVLNDLNYEFSSSTTPIYGMWNGPLIRTQSGLFEIPVTGCFDYPGRILDSWGFRFSPTRKFSEHDYGDQFNKLVQYFQESSGPGILNIYADPSQVYDWSLFFECMANTHGLVNTSFEGLVKKVNHE